jgi:DNA-directed RNA polymerase specialized sigma24 family protein
MIDTKLYKKLLNIASNHLKNKQDAEDIVQDVVCSSLKKDQKQSDAYWKKAIYYSCLNFRRNKSRIDYVDAAQLEKNQSTELDVVEKLRLIELDKWSNKLPEKRKNVFLNVLKYDVEGAAYKMDKNKNTVKVLWKLAHKQFKSDMEKGLI